VIFGNILHSTPIPSTQLNSSVPPELERILNKLLEKDKDFRYQIAAELRADLKRLQRELEPGRVSSDSSVLASRGSNPTVPAAGSGSAAPVPPQPIPPPAPARHSGSSKVLVEAAQKNKLGASAVILLSLLVAAAAIYGVYAFVKMGQKPKTLPFEKFSIENVSNNGHISQAAISPDGKYLLQALEENGEQSLWLRHIPTSTNKQVVAPALTRYQGLAFSPDGNYIFFLRRDEQNESESQLYSASVLGGAPRVIVDDIDSPVSFSPDGQHFVFLRELHDSPNWDLLVAKTDGTIDRPIFRNHPLLSDSYVPAWSPDGKLIIIPIVQPTKDALGGFLAVDPATGKDEVAAISPERIYHAPVWMPEGTALIVTEVQADVEHMQAQIGYVNYPGGEFRALTDDTNDYANLGISKDGKTIAAIQSKLHLDLGLAPDNNPDQLTGVPLQSELPIWRWTWMPDGRLLLPQGGSLKAVTAKDEETILFTDPKHIADQVAVCGNERYVVFREIGRTSAASANLARMDLNGANVKQLTSGINDREPECAKTGDSVYYVDNTDNRYVKRVSIDGGSPETVVKFSVGGFSLSPDGKEIASFEVRELDHKLMLRIDDLVTQKVTYNDIDQRALGGDISFTPDGKGVLYVVREKGVDNLWLQPLDGKVHRQLTHFNKDRIFRFVYSPDGSQLAIERGTVESDAVLLHDEAK
jgi:eukaryotic-like serine/threonine-protein kinase